jgi:hypothetical protein
MAWRVYVGRGRVKVEKSIPKEKKDVRWADFQPSGVEYEVPGRWLLVLEGRARVISTGWKLPHTMRSGAGGRRLHTN